MSANPQILALDTGETLGFTSGGQFVQSSEDGSIAVQPRVTQLLAAGNPDAALRVHTGLEPVLTATDGTPLVGAVATIDSRTIGDGAVANSQDTIAGDGDDAETFTDAADAATGGNAEISTGGVVGASSAAGAGNESDGVLKAVWGVIGVAALLLFVKE